MSQRLFTCAPDPLALIPCLSSPLPPAVVMHVRHAVYLLVYILTGAANSLLVKRSQILLPDGTRHYAYEPVAVTSCVTLSKLALTTLYVLFVQHPTTPLTTTLTALSTRRASFPLFFIPAGLYFLFDTLAFFNLQLVQPATFRLLINLKVLFSGLLLYLIIGQRLTVQQWVALLILVVACGVEQIDSFDTTTGLYAILMISLQALCSSTAGVYFQFLLQGKRGDGLGLWEKNLFLYTWAVVFNVLYLALFAPHVLRHPLEATATFDWNVLPIILTSAIGGFCTSLILRDLDVIMKEYANFAEMCVVVLGGWLVLGAPIHATLILAVGMVTVSLYLYNVPTVKVVDKEALSDGEKSETEDTALGEEEVEKAALISTHPSHEHTNGTKEHSATAVTSGSV